MRKVYCCTECLLGLLIMVGWKQGKTLGTEEGSMFGSAVLVESSIGNTLGIFAKFCVWTAAM
jgi:hypothetical protein